MAGFLRMHEQLRALWKGRDKAEQPFVRGLVLTGGGNGLRVTERWFTVLGHALFYSINRDSPEYSGVFLADIFYPVISRVDEGTLNVFNATDKKVFALHLRGVCMNNVEILLCPRSPEEKKFWMDKMHDAGLSVPTREPSDKRKDGREKVVVIGGDVNDRLYHSPSPEISGTKRQWRQEWKRAAMKVLTLPDAAQIRKRTQVLEKLVTSEERYVDDLSILVNMYYKQLKVAVTSGHLPIHREQLDTIFLNCESLLILHKLFLSQLQKAFSCASPLFGEIFEFFIPHMEIYIEFIKNYEKCIQVLEECQANASFSAFLENHHCSHDCEGQQLRLLLYTPVTRLTIYWSFLEEILKNTSEHHVDYRPLGTALESLQDLIQGMTKDTSELEEQERLLAILRGVGDRGFVLLEPECTLILEGDMYIPFQSKWGSLKRRPVHCYLYSNALVVISKEKKVQSQVFPLSGASVYEHVSASGEVTFARDPDLDIRALKLYSPEGPRNGVVITFVTQNAKSLWLAKISEMIGRCSPESESRTPSPLFPLRRASSVFSINGGDQREAAAGFKPPLPPRPSSYLPQKPASYHGAPSSPLHRPLDRATSNSSPSPNLLSVPGFGQLSRASSMLSLTQSPKSSPLPPRPPQYYSIPMLFGKLTNPPDPFYPATFLLTYRMFTNAHEVLDALIEEHRQDLGNRKGREITLSTQSLRFFNTLRMWVNKYYVDFHHDVTLKRVLVVYLNNIKQNKYIHEKECELADSILRTVSQRGHIPMTRKSKLKVQLPRTKKQTPVSFTEVSPEDVAKQLTWIEHEIYSRIKPYEFLQQKWTKKNKQELAPNICYVISRFNQMTLWITKEVLSHDTPHHRAIIIQKLLEITDNCLKLSNYVTLFQITAALNSGPIQRLNRTWQLLPQAAMDQFEEFKRLTSLEGGSKIYRDRQKSTASPSIPYIGPYLNQLISIEVGMPTFVKSPPEHVNFSKLTRLGAIIEELTRFQNPRYCIEPDGAILGFVDRALESAEGYTEDQRYHRSLELEPRQSTREKAMIFEAKLSRKNSREYGKRRKTNGNSKSNGVWKRTNSSSCSD